MRCLLIEDNAANAYLIEVLLGHRGHSVSIAKSGAEAVTIAGAQPFDVILMDLKLPDGDGCVFVPQLKAVVSNDPVPVVAVSAHALAADQQRALDVGCRGFIEKPIDVATFVDRVEALAGGAG
jgi:two-component system cell cycle response regulator DivK